MANDVSPERRDTFFGLTKTGAARLFVLLSIIVLTALISYGGVRLAETHSQASATQEQVQQNKQVLAQQRQVLARLKKVIAQERRGLAYICSTTSVLDKLVVTARDQVKQNLDNGTYEKLLRQGVLTEANVESAQATVDAYGKAHVTLKHNRACRDLQR